MSDAFVANIAVSPPQVERLGKSKYFVLQNTAGNLFDFDLNYPEDRDAQVDMNVVMTGTGRLVEVQAGGEEHDFSREEFQSLLTLAQDGLRKVLAFQESCWKSRPKAAALSRDST